MISSGSLVVLATLICLSMTLGWIFNSICTELIKEHRMAKLGHCEGYGDDLLLMENQRLRQMLEIAANDIYYLDGSDPDEYLHDLGTRDYYAEDLITMEEWND